MEIEELVLVDDEEEAFTEEGFAGALKKLEGFLEAETQDLPTIRGALLKLKSYLAEQPSRYSEMLPEEIGMLVKGIIVIEKKGIEQDVEKAAKRAPKKKKITDDFGDMLADLDV